MEKKKSEFCQKVPTNPFTIGVDIVKQLSDEEEENNIEYLTEEHIEEEEEETEELFNPLPILVHTPNHNFTGPGNLLTRLFELNSDSKEKEEKNLNNGNIFKSDECIICLTNSPKVCFVIVDI